MRTRPATPDVGERDVEVPGLGRGQPFGLGLLGVEPGLGLLDQPAQLGGADRVRERRDLGVHERRRLRGETHGALGDEREPPRRQLTGLEPGPAAREPVEPLDRMGQVAAPGLGGAAQGGGELDDRELRHLRDTPRHPAAGSDSCHAIGRPDQRLRGVHRRPPRGRPHHLPSGVVLGPPCGPAQPPARRRGRRAPASGSGSKVEVIVGPTQPPTTDTRAGSDHRCGQGIPAPWVWTKVASSAGCGGFETVAARPPQPPVGRSQPDQTAPGQHSAVGLPTYPPRVRWNQRSGRSCSAGPGRPGAAAQLPVTARGDVLT